MVLAMSLQMTSCAYGSTKQECPTGLTCQAPVEGCITLTCDDATGVNMVDCQGTCLPMAAELLSAQIMPDGRSLFLAANTPAAVRSSMECASILSPATFLAVGGADALCVVTPTGAGLEVVMAPTASLLPGETFALLESQGSLVAALTGVPFILSSGALVVSGCAPNCTPPVVVLSGPTQIVEPCPGEVHPAAPAAVFNVAASADPSGRRYANVQWSPAPLGSNNTMTPSLTLLLAALEEQNALQDIR